jgi:hypothetical protein
VDSLGIHLVGNAWREEAGSCKPHGTKRGLLVGSWTTGSSGETSVGTCKLDEAIEKSCSDLLDIYNRKCIHDRMEIF